MTDTQGTVYSLGHSRDELDRLTRQAAVLRPITERLLRAAGIGPGMRVLDLGCGTGDVTMLAAELVGPSGSVTGIDRSADAVAAAADRARSAGLEAARFVQSAAADFEDPAGFDCVVGRYVVIHQPDPAAFLATAARLARPGGVIAFHEMDVLRGAWSLPRVPLVQETSDLIIRAGSSVSPHADAAGRFIEFFAAAGLPEPKLFSENIVGGGNDTPLYGMLADTLRSMLPLLAGEGITTDTIGAGTLETRIREEAVASRSQVEWPPQYCAWTIVPPSRHAPGGSRRPTAEAALDMFSVR